VSKSDFLVFDAMSLVLPLEAALEITSFVSVLLSPALSRVPFIARRAASASFSVLKSTKPKPSERVLGEILKSQCPSKCIT
jgi:hypothetical protein